MAFFKENNTSNFYFENEVLDIKTILGNVFLYSEIKNINKEISRFHELFKNKNEALLYSTKRYNEYLEEKQGQFKNEPKTKRLDG